MNQSQLNRSKALWMAAGLLIALALSSVSVQAIGVTPGRRTIDFQPGLEQELSFTILNNEKKDMKVLVYVEEGYLSGVITLNKVLLDFSSGDESKSFSYTVKLPETVDKPGSNEIRLVAMELPKDVENPGSFVGATTAVVHQLVVRVPYPGKYAETDLIVSQAQPGETVTFYVKANNFGDQDINNAYSTIEILGPTNEVIATLESEGKPIKSKQKDEFVVSWKADVNPGMYHVKAYLHYDDNVAVVEKNFAVGNLFVDIKDVTVRNYRLGGVAKFEITAESKWNKKVEDLFADVKVFSSGGGELAEFKSPSTSIEPFETKTLVAYWDTAGVDKGEYDAKATLYYDGKTTEKLLKAYISLESLDTQIVGITARAIKTEQQSGSIDILVPLVLLLVFINIGWLFYFRRRK